MSKGGKGGKCRDHNGIIGGETKLNLPFGGLHDDNLNQMSEIKELSRKIAIWIEDVQHLHPSIEVNDGSKNAQIQFEYLFDTPNWSRFDYTWENNINDELFELYDSFNTEILLIS